MIANIWAEATHAEQTLSTLRFAARVKLIETDAVVNESTDPAFLVKKLERQVRGSTPHPLMPNAFGCFLDSLPAGVTRSCLFQTRFRCVWNSFVNKLEGILDYAVLQDIVSSTVQEAYRYTPSCDIWRM
jgi:hypothetical protein